MSLLLQQVRLLLAHCDVSNQLGGERRLTQRQWSFAESTASRFVRRAAAEERAAARIHATRPAGAPDAAAWVNRSTGVAEFVASMLGYDERDAPERIDLMRPVDRARHPVLAGAVAHEAAHVAHTRWPQRGTAPADREAAAAAHLLEEARCEGRLLTRRPADRMLLRAATAHVVLTGLGRAVDGRQVAGTVLALVLPRVDTGVFPADRVAALRGQVQEVVGAAGVAVFEGLWRRALRVADGDGVAMLQIGREWVEATREFLPPDPNGQQQAGCGGRPEERPAGGLPVDPGSDGGEPGDDGAAADGDHDAGRGQGGVLPDIRPGCAETDTATGGQPETESSGDQLGADPTGDPGAESSGDQGGALRAALVDIRDTAAADINPDLNPPPAAPRPDPGDPVAAQHADIANQVFGGGSGASAPSVITYLPPDLAALTLRAVMVNRLRQARIRRPDRRAERVGHPAGRMSATRLMDRAAQIATRQPVTALPWIRRTVRTHDQPPWQCGIVLDTSGSMSQWWAAAATTLWALSNAVTQLGGQAAAASFSGQVAPLLHPGQVLPGVPVITGGGGSNKAGDAMLALAGTAHTGVAAVSGVLRIAGSRGARVQVVITDSDLPDSDDVQDAVDYLTGRGVAVVWAVTVPRPAWTPTRATVITDVAPDQVGVVLIDACETALRSVNDRA